MYILTVSTTLEDEYKATCFKKHGERLFTVTSPLASEIIALARTLDAEIQTALGADYEMVYQLEKLAHEEAIKITTY